MTSDADIAAVYKLAFDEALRSIGDQRHTLETVRARGGILLSAASVVTSFLGGQALADGDLGVAGWLAIASFGGVGLFALAMLLLKGRLSFHVSPTQLIVGYIEGESTPPLADIYRDLSINFENGVESNSEFIRRLDAIFAAGALMLMVELICWIIELVGSVS
jgi:hypothetical protein